MAQERWARLALTLASVALWGAAGCGTDTAEEIGSPLLPGADTDAAGQPEEVASPPEDGVEPDTGPAEDVVGPDDTGDPTDAPADAAPDAPAEDTAGPDGDGEAPDAPPPVDTDDAADGASGDAEAGEAGTSGCALHTSCLDGDFCTKDLCEAGECTHEPAACDDGDPCTTDACDPLAGCTFTYTGGPGCTPSTALFSATFDDGTLQGVTVVDLVENVGPGGAPVVWTPDPSLTFSGAGALYFGIPGVYHFDNGKVVASAARTPPRAIPAGQRARLSFRAWLDVEDEVKWTC